MNRDAWPITRQAVSDGRPWLHAAASETGPGQPMEQVMSDHEDWTDPYPMVANRVKLTRARLRARHKGEDPQPVLPEGWPPAGWESGDMPVNDSNEAVTQWLKLVGAALEQLDALANANRLELDETARKEGKTGPDLGGPIGRDCWRLLRHLREQGRWLGDLPEFPGRTTSPGEALALLDNLRDLLKGKGLADGVEPNSWGIPLDKFSRLQRSLLEALMGGVSVPTNELMKVVYGSEVPLGRLEQLIVRVNRRLAEVGANHEIKCREKAYRIHPIAE